MSDDERSVPRGDLVPWTEAELDALSDVTEDDLSRAQANARTWLPPRLRRLLDARATQASPPDPVD